MGAGAVAAGIGAAGAIGSAAIGSSKSGKSGGSSNSISTPWQPQESYITGGFQDALNTYGNGQAYGPYQGNTVAGQNPYQVQAINSATGYANGQGPGVAIPGITAGTAGTLQGYAPTFAGNAAGIAANGLGGNYNTLANVLNGYATGKTPALSINPQLSGALTNAAVNGANSLNGFTSGQQQVMNEALADPTQQLAANAQTYMNSAPVQSALNSTNALIDQTLNEQTVPQLNRNAEMGGNLNSSRAGMAEAMANENAALAKGNADASILNNAFNTGLSTAAAERNAGLTTGMYAANSGLVDNTGLAQGQQNSLINQGEFGTNTALGAAQAGIGALNANTGAMLNANGQLGQGVGMGVNAGTSAGQQAGQNFGLLSGAGQLQQQADQAALTNPYNQWQINTQYPWQNLDNYWNIVGSRSWGGMNNQATSGSQVNTARPDLAGALGNGSALAGGISDLLGGGGSGGLVGNSGSTPNDVGSGVNLNDYFTSGNTLFGNGDGLNTVYYQPNQMGYVDNTSSFI